MTHELKQIVNAHLEARNLGLKTVLVTVVALEGSSYRRPGVRMLILEDQRMVGAVSGGCVEKEVMRQSASVFIDSIPKMMTYDGRYRLGCEGLLHLLIEPFSPPINSLNAFQYCIKERMHIQLNSYFKTNEREYEGMGTIMKLKGEDFYVNQYARVNTQLQLFKQNLAPCFKLIIIGAEHDAIELSSFANALGWEVTVIVHPADEKEITDFNDGITLSSVLAEQMDVSGIDHQTAVMLMTHSYAKDLQFLIALQSVNSCYIGLLGPNKRREKLLNEFLEHCPEVASNFFDRLYGPAGLDIGAETPQEIAIAILSEILSIVRKRTPVLLRDKIGGIHQ